MSWKTLLLFGHRAVSHLRWAKKHSRSSGFCQEIWRGKWRVAMPLPSVHNRGKASWCTRSECSSSQCFPIDGRRCQAILLSTNSTWTWRWQTALQTPCHSENKEEETPTALAKEFSMPTWHCYKRSRTPPNCRARECMVSIAKDICTASLKQVHATMEDRSITKVHWWMW